ncbi:hypothetical protein [Tritonibacter mobilis]|uniref:DUF7483 domain-containing protein n=1 Tax=Tritonibacter mobilis TaxID=379347 RepID=UPI003A5C0CB6
MSILTNHMLMAAAGARGSGPSVADVFKTTTYSGNGAATRIFGGGPDMAGLGGLAIHKARNAIDGWVWEDSVRGAGNWMDSSANTPSAYASNAVKSFNSDGVTIGDDVWMNQAGDTYVQYLIARSEKFFDVVTYTGDGVGGRSVPHNLGCTPGMIVVKRTNATTAWLVQHRGVPQNSGAPGYLYLNAQNNAATGAAFVWPQAADDTAFFLGTEPSLNASGGTYVAYIFAHDTASDGLIQCGSYTGNGSTTGPVVSLGWKPQWLLVRGYNLAGDWGVFDAARSPGNPRDKYLNAASSGQEGSGRAFDFLPTGFQPKNSEFDTNSSGGQYIYMAIRAEGV